MGTAEASGASEADAFARLRTTRGRLIETGVAAVCFVALALLWTFPLIQHRATHIPGEGAGDNVAALWNFWWARFAATHDLSPFQTSHLFAPHGARLALHTHTALPAFVGATLLRALPLVTAHNLVLIATLALNGLCAYWLLRRESGDWWASLLGGAIFAGAPFVSAHVHGHFNVLSAWPLPLVCLAARAGMPIVLGATIGLTAYLDYYYVLYSIGLAGTLLVLQRQDVRIRWSTGPRRTAATDRWLVGMILVVAAIVLGILITGGGSVTLGSVPIRLNEPFNGLQILGLLVVITAWRRWRPQLLHSARHSAEPSSWTTVMMATGAAIAVSAPLLIAGIALIANGDYVTQAYQWRSGPQGVDVATVAIGPPFHWINHWSHLVYRWRGIDPIERSAWIGVVPLGLALAGWRLAPAVATTRWLVVGGLSLVWALGPHLRVFGWNTGFILPNALLRYVPVLSNARIPGRAMVVVGLAVAVLSAFAIAHLRRRGWRGIAVAALTFVVFADLWPGRVPLLELDHPPLYDALRDHPASGSVLELPMGVRDGFGETGRLDHRTLWYQTIHERPIVGGFVARLPRSTEQAYASDPLLSALLAWSSGSEPPPGAPPEGDEARRALHALGVRFVVFNRRASTPALRDWVDRLPRVPLATDHQRELYLIV